MKLLIAFIDAMGYEVKTINNKEYGRKLSSENYINPSFAQIRSGCAWEFIDGYYREIVRTVDYKVTKKVNGDV